MEFVNWSWYLPFFLKSQWFNHLPYPTADFSGQTVIVTGSNTGLGLEAARHLVRLKASKVILAVRTISKGEAAAKDIVRSCKVSASVIEIWQLDMANAESVKEFAKRTQTLSRLDAAILNAGMLSQKFTSAQGIESHIAVNTVHSLLLAVLLLPVMRASAQKTGSQGRLTYVGSDLMYIAPLSEIEGEEKIFNRLNDAKRARMSVRYAISKQLSFWAFRALTEQHSASDLNVTVNVVTTGLCKSTLNRNAGVMAKLITDAIIIGVRRTTEVGGRHLVNAVGPRVPAETHGKFLMNGVVGYDGYNVTKEQGRGLANKWNAELFAKLEELAPGCLKL